MILASVMVEFVDQHTHNDWNEVEPSGEARECKVTAREGEKGNRKEAKQ